MEKRKSLWTAFFVYALKKSKKVFYFETWLSKNCCFLRVLNFGMFENICLIFQNQENYQAGWTDLCKNRAFNFECVESLRCQQNESFQVHTLSVNISKVQPCEWKLYSPSSSSLTFFLFYYFLFNIEPKKRHYLIQAKRGGVSWVRIVKLTTALKRVDLPTLGRPTMPALRLMLIFDEEDDDSPLLSPPITPISLKWFLCCFSGWSSDGIKWLLAILAIFRHK